MLTKVTTLHIQETCKLATRTPKIQLSIQDTQKAEFRQKQNVNTGVTLILTISITLQVGVETFEVVNSR